MTKLDEIRGDRRVSQFLETSCWQDFPPNDGEIQAEERQYPHRMAEQNNLSADPKIRTLLPKSFQTTPNNYYCLVEKLYRLPSYSNRIYSL